MTKQQIKYIELLQLAEEAESRRDAIYLIRQADKLRMEMQHDSST